MEDVVTGSHHTPSMRVFNERHADYTLHFVLDAPRGFAVVVVGLVLQHKRYSEEHRSGIMNGKYSALSHRLDMWHAVVQNDWNLAG